MAALLSLHPFASPAVPAGAQEAVASGHDVFISYARNDREFVAGLARALDARGVRAWYDANVEGKPADNLARLEEARLLLVVFSSSSNTEAGLTRQLALADRHSIPVAPVLLDEAAPSGARLMALCDRIWTSVRREDLASVEAVADQIAGLVGPREAGGAASAYVGRRAGSTRAGEAKHSLFGWIDAGLLALLVAAVGGWVWLSLNGRGGSLTVGSAVLMVALLAVGFYLAVAFAVRLSLRLAAPLHPARTLLLAAGVPVGAAGLVYSVSRILGAFAADDPIRAAALFLGLIAVYAALGGLILVLLSGRGAMRRFRANIRKI